MSGQQGFPSRVAGHQLHIIAWQEYSLPLPHPVGRGEGERERLRSDDERGVGIDMREVGEKWSEERR